MSNFVVPNTFTAGTKAKAEEVNENFTAIKDDLDTKSGQIQTLQTDVNTKVLKAGDTMTGDLIISKTSPVLTLDSSSTNTTYGKFYIKGARFTASDTTAPSSNMNNGGFYIQDSDNNLNLYIETAHNTSNNINTRIATRRVIDGSNVTAPIDIGVGVSGNTYFSFPMCTTAATTTSTAATNKVATVVKNYKSGTSWYRVWSDSWIEQGGQIASGSGKKTVSFLKSFADTSYTIQLAQCLPSSTYSGTDYTSYYRDKAKTGFSIYQSGDDSRYTSWYACGY